MKKIDFHKAARFRNDAKVYSLNVFTLRFPAWRQAGLRLSVKHNINSQIQ